MSECLTNNSSDKELPVQQCDELDSPRYACDPFTNKALDLLQAVIISINNAPNFAIALEGMVQKICTMTEWSIGEVWLPSADGSYLECSPIWYTNSPDRLQSFRQISLSQTFELGEGLPGRVWLHRRPESQLNLTELPNSIFKRSQAALDAGLNAALGIPILSGDRVLAVLTFFMFESRLEELQFVELVTAIAVHFGTLMQLKQTEKALRESESRFRAVFENAAIGFSLTSSEGILLESNAALLEMLGYGEAELKHLSFTDLTHPDDAEADWEQYRKLIAGKFDSYHLEKRYVRKDGVLFWGRLTVSAVRSAEGQLLFTIALVENINERKQAERSLQEREAFLRLILDNIPQHIFWKDENLTYQGCNLTFASSIGLSSPNELIGRTDYDLWPIEQAEAYRSRDRHVLETGESYLHMIRSRIQPNGDLIWQDVSKVPVHDSDGRVIGVLGTFEDITERRHASEELARRERYLAGLVEVQRRLLKLDNAPDRYQQILEPLGKSSSACRVYIFENSFNEHGQLCMTQKAEWCREGVEQQLHNAYLQNLPYAEVCPRWAEELGRGKIISGAVRTFPDTEYRDLSAQGILSILVLPLIVSGQFFGFIGFDNTREERPWDALEVDLLRVAAAAIALTQQRRDAELALRESEQRYRLLADNSTDLISRHTPEGKYLYASPACFSLMGLRPDEVVGHSIYDSVHPDDLPIVQQHYAEVNLLSGEVAPFTYRIRHHEGHYIWLETMARAIHDSTQERVQEIIAVSRNVTERKKAETLLFDQKQVLEMIAKGAPLSETLTLLIQTIELHMAGSMGSILMLQPDSLHLQYGAAPSLPQGYIDATNHLTISPTTGSCGVAAYSGNTVIAADILNDPFWVNYADLASQYGIRSCWSTPIKSPRGVVVGTLAIYHLTPYQPTEDDRRVIEIATQLAGIAIERQRAEDALRQAESKYRSIFENAVEGIFQSTADGRYITANPMLAKMYGYDSPEDMISTLTDITHQLYVDPSRRQDFINLMREPGSVLGFESQVYRKDGSTIWISECATAVYNQDGQLVSFEGTVEDITRRKQAEAELHKRDRLLQGMAEATSVLLTHLNLTAAAPQALKILGEASEADRAYIFQMHSHPSRPNIQVMSIRHEWARSSVPLLSEYEHCHNLIYNNNPLQRWIDVFQQGGSICGLTCDLPDVERLLLETEGVVSVMMVPIFIDDQIWGFVGFDDCHSDRRWLSSEESLLVTMAASIGSAIKRENTEEQMRHQAFHDALTGLPNRPFFNHQLHLALAHSQRNHEMLGVMFLDLDRFKTINDTLGHAVGDRLLIEATRRLLQCLRDEDVVARWGGDEFTILLPNLKAPEDASKVAQRILDALKPIFFLEEQELHITSSIGIALFPENGSDAETLLKNADAALYRVKEQGRNGFQFYTAAINSQATELLTLESSLHHALERGEFVLHYQPQVNVMTGRVTQMEALIRWQHPQLGLVSPQTFIKLAEDNGLIVPIGEWVLQTATRQNKRWHDLGISHLRVAVNLSARQFQQPKLVKQVEQILLEAQLEPTFLELEITETAAMQDADLTSLMLHGLKSMGVRIAMDDFGTGYSSLSYLKKFPLHAIKIDRSFIQDLAENPENDAIARAIITLGKGLNLNIVAEGVETVEQLELLRSLQCEEMQGYWFSRPLPAEAATEFLLNQRSVGNTVPHRSLP